MKKAMLCALVSLLLPAAGANATSSDAGVTADARQGAVAAEPTPEAAAPTTVPSDVGGPVASPDEPLAATPAPPYTPGAPPPAPAFSFDPGDGAFLTRADGSGLRYDGRIDARSGAVCLRRLAGQSGVCLTPVAGVLPAGDGAERERAVVFAAGPEIEIRHTPEASRLKEDIILAVPQGDALVFEWDLALDPGLDARLDADGNVDVYGPSDFLAGDIQVGDERSRGLLAKLRARNAHAQLLYQIPAPVVIDATGVRMTDIAHFTLDGTRLRLFAHGLAALAYPVTIDPTIVTTTADFALRGNLETGATVANDQLTRTPTAGGVASWSYGPTLPSGLTGAGAVAYNGWLYVTGGGTSFPSSYLPSNQARRAAINANGTLGNWLLPETNSLAVARGFHASVVYNGYLYALGGQTSAGPTDSVEFASLNSDGSVGTWHTTAVLPAARQGHAAVVHGGRLYMLGGLGTAATNEVQKAVLRADGTIASWSATQAFAGPRYYHAAVAHNGRILLAGGFSGTTSLADVQTGSIDPASGEVAWRAAPSTALPLARYGHAIVAYGGYAYVSGGYTGTYTSEVLAAPLDAEGGVGAWMGNPGLNTARAYHAATAYGGWLYAIGGLAFGTFWPYSVATVETTQVQPPGRPSAWASSGTFTTARYKHATLVHNGYVYIIGGQNSSGTLLNDIRFAPISADGTLGTWGSATASWSGRSSFGAAVYNGYLYIVGGLTASGRVNEVWVAPLVSGAPGAWSGPNTPSPAWPGRAEHTVAAHAGYLYVMGGTSTGTDYLRDLYYAPLTGANGVPGTWYPAAQPDWGARKAHASVVYGNRLYVLGGTNGSPNAETWYTTLGSGGVPGSWTQGPSFTTRRYLHGAVAHEGYLYLMGGMSAPGTYLSDLEVAAIDAAGAVGGWSVRSTTAYNRAGAGWGAYNGRLLAAGGQYLLNGNPAYLDSVSNQPLAATGAVGAWNRSSYAWSQRYGHTSVAYQGRLYLIGGHTAAGTNPDEFLVAPINDDGSLGSWQTYTQAQTGGFGGRYFHTSVLYNGYVVIMGGTTDGITPLNTIKVCQLSATGAPTCSSAPAPSWSGRWLHTSALWKNYVYVIGGRDATTTYSHVCYAALSWVGVPGIWTCPSSAWSPRSGAAAAAYNGYLYVTGGWDTAKNLDEVRFALINDETGAPTGWSVTTPFAHKPRSGHKVVAKNGHLYLTGGWYANGYFGDIQYAPINSDGTLGSWTSGPQLTVARVDHGMTEYGGRLYISAGEASAAPPYFQDVEYATLQQPENVGVYSRLIEFQVPVRLDYLTLNRTTASRGLVLVDYRTADASGIFGNLQSKGVIGPGSYITFGDLAVRYLWLRLTLDDTMTAAINPEAANLRDVTDFTVDYTDLCAGGCGPPPNTCYNAAICNPSNGACDYAPKAAGTECRASAGPCDLAETCDGAGTPCPIDAKVTGGTQCRAATGECDLADFCNGFSAACPDYFKPDGASCTDDGKPCTTDTCNGSGTCTHVAGNAGLVCRPAEGLCDAADTCTGTSPECPDAKLPAGTVCRAAVGACDRAETCDGVSKECPTDIFELDGTFCDDTTVCNGRERCFQGACVAGTPLDCSDGLACTTDSCDPVSGCRTPVDSCVAPQSCQPTGQCGCIASKWRSR
ncbi:MAG TPA: hypothetical protein VGQ83_24515 [Polyangia bacterium]|jgi:hypothetical protein